MFANMTQVIKYIDAGLAMTFPPHSLRVNYEPSEGTMMIDVSTIYSLELVQNLQNPKSRDCLFGLLNQTQTPMGARLLRSNILQPLTETETLNTRYDALEELTTKEEMFFATRSGLLGCILPILIKLIFCSIEKFLRYRQTPDIGKFLIYATQLD